MLGAGDVTGACGAEGGAETPVDGTETGGEGTLGTDGTGGGDGTAGGGGTVGSVGVAGVTGAVSSAAAPNGNASVTTQATTSTQRRPSNPVLFIVPPSSRYVEVGVADVIASRGLAPRAGGT